MTATQTLLIAIASALAGAIFTEATKYFGEYLRRRREREAEKRLAPLKSAPIVDIRAVWESETGKESERITIEEQDGRRVSGIRVYRSGNDTEFRYAVIGFFDGKTLALAASCTDPLEARTLTILMHRKRGNVFEGTRTWDSGEGVRTTDTRVWTRR